MGSINKATDVLVGVEMFAASVDGVGVVAGAAPTLRELGVPVVKKPIVLITRKSPTVRYAISACNKLLRAATIALLKPFTRLRFLRECT